MRSTSAQARTSVRTSAEIANSRFESVSPGTFDSSNSAAAWLVDITERTHGAHLQLAMDALRNVFRKLLLAASNRSAPRIRSASYRVPDGTPSSSAIFAASSTVQFPAQLHFFIIVHEFREARPRPNPTLTQSIDNAAAQYDRLPMSKFRFGPRNC